MSHFSVLVIGGFRKLQLAPFHEFECTGNNDKYVQDIDVTKEKREEYESGTSSRMKDKDGNLFDTYSDQFYREPTDEEMEEHSLMGSGCGGGISWTSKDWGDGKGYRAKVSFTPDGFEEVKLPYSELMSFREYVEEYEEIAVVKSSGVTGIELSEDHKYGYCIVDAKGEVEKVVDRTNPNSKWDWYQLGGRWTGYFKLRSGATGETGKAGLMTKPAKPGYADAAQKCDIDFEGMRNEAYQKAVKFYDEIEAMCGGKIPQVEKSWEQCQEEHKNIGDARGAYYEQDSIKQFKEATKESKYWLSLSDYQCTREEYGESARNNAIPTFAVIKDGKWYEKGEMGWWACVSNEKDESDWHEEFNKLIDGLPKETLLSVYDCHI